MSDSFKESCVKKATICNRKIIKQSEYHKIDMYHVVIIFLLLNSQVEIRFSHDEMVTSKHEMRRYKYSVILFSFKLSVNV